ncbi:lysophospholipid acyltransferase family protein [Desulfohalovibrio reitneri]|uniref:lysophospholipid acyltransferase family protein n=1 Tax=Desulfohalovibrio reitneri TaxID=1307759 RepID=UPI0004A6BA7D|nr:lysophospholipid acyltransferase family protein [Desulfohalovibrio reitneri]
MRTVFFYLIFIPATLVLASTSLLVPRLADWVHRNWSGIALWAAGVRVEADLDALTPGEPYVFLANHQSMFDILVLFRLLSGHRLRFVAKESLFRIPIFGPAMRRVGHVPIDRGNSLAAMKSLDRAAAEAGREGISLLVFPEGTRNPDPHDFLPFRTGGMILALKAAKIGLRTAPLAIRGSGGVMAAKSLRVRSGTVFVRALPPFNPAEHYTLKQRDVFRDDLRRQLRDAYMELGLHG